MAIKGLASIDRIAHTWPVRIVSSETISTAIIVIFSSIFSKERVVARAIDDNHT
jgi:hypothetical protein